MPVCPKCHEENPQLGARCPRDGHYFIPKSSLVDAKKDPMIGSIAADKYVVLGLISEGGMGAVYRALQLPVEREVALKVLRTELQDSDQGRDRFILEARAVSRLTHPNIITLHDFGFDSSQHPYMVMEYAPGKSLARWLRDDVTLDRIVHVMKQVLSALSEAHDRGIVHRDLKPENMIVTKAGADRDYVKLLDFGIARMINEGATRKLTREGEVFGTPHYMAPEQAQGKKNVGPPADVYACGIILWELICGHCPFDAPTPLAVLFMHINEDLPPLNPRQGVTVPPEIRAVLDRATKKDPLARYQHAGEMLGALTKAAEKAKANRNSAPAPKSKPKPKSEKKRSSSSSGFDPSKPISLASRAEASESSNDLPVYDPEPSMEHPGLQQRTSSSPGTNPNISPKGTNPPKEDEAKLKLSIAALVILIGLAGILVGSVFLFGGEETAEAEASEVAAVEDDSKAPTEKSDEAAESKSGPAVAANTDDDKNPVEDTPENTPDNVEDPIPTSVKDPVDPSTVAGHSPPGEDSATMDEPKEAPQDPEKAEPAKVEPTKAEPAKVEPKKTEPKKTEPKKTVKKTEPKTTTTTSDTKKSDDEDEPKKFEPKAFEAPPPTKWK